VVNPLSSMLTADEVQYAVTDTGASAVIASPDQRELLDGLKAQGGRFNLVLWDEVPVAGATLLREWLDGGGLPMGVSLWEHVQGWWDARHLPNVMLLHYNNLKADLPGEVRRIATFLDIPIDGTLGSHSRLELGHRL